jgi:exopolysaccharide production protein ExoZ
MNDRIEGIQILRFVAATLVLIGHVFQEIHQKQLVSESVYRTLDSFPWGAGVDLFFVISGYIIFGVASTAKSSLGDSIYFLGRRVIRVAPVYWFYTALMVVALYVFKDKIENSGLSVSNLFASLFFLPSLNLNGALRPVLEQGWTLNHEFYFYCLVGFAILAPARWRLSVVVCIVTAVQLLATSMLGQHWLAAFYAYDIVYEFLFGAALFQFLPAQIRISPVLRISLVALGLFALWMSTNLGAAVPRAIAQGLPATLIVFACLFSVKEKSRRAVQPLVTLGDASYSLYLAHPFAVNLVIIILAKLKMDSAILIFIVATIASYSFALASYWLLESPSNHYLRRKWNSFAKQNFLTSRQPVQQQT